MRASEVEQMLQLYHQFVCIVDGVRQYSDPKVQKILYDQIPTLRKIEGVGLFASAVAKWVYTYMKWDDSPALPRYTDILQILKYKRGRCGEYANLFTGMLIAGKVEARLIFDFSDHVWTEIKYGDKWIPLDCTLANPEVGQFFRDDKPLSYILAFTSSRVEDVTKNYTEQWAEVEKRRNFTPLVEILIETFNLGAERKDWE